MPRLVLCFWAFFHVHHTPRQHPGSAWFVESRNPFQNSNYMKQHGGILGSMYNGWRRQITNNKADLRLRRWFAWSCVLWLASCITRHALATSFLLTVPNSEANLAIWRYVHLTNNVSKLTPVLHYYPLWYTHTQTTVVYNFYYGTWRLLFLY